MARCTICNHPRRDDIEASLDLGWSQRAVGERFGVSASALSRHHCGHHTRLRDLERELAQVRRQKDRIEHASALKTIFARAGCRDAHEIGELVGRINAALVVAEDYVALADFMRATGSPESSTWELIEMGAGFNGDDPEEVFASIFEPAGLESEDG